MVLGGYRTIANINTMKYSSHIENLESTQYVYKPTLLYALLKYIKYPIIGFVMQFFILLVPVNNQYESTVFNGMGKLVLVIFLLVYAYKVLYLTRTTYSFENEHLEITRGLFSIQNDYIQYYRIKDLKRFRSFGARIINTMDVTLITSDRFNQSVLMYGIQNDKHLPNELRNLVEKERANKRVFEVD